MMNHPPHADRREGLLEQREHTTRRKTSLFPQTEKSAKHISPKQNTPEHQQQTATKHGRARWRGPNYGLHSFNCGTAAKNLVHYAQLRSESPDGKEDCGWHSPKLVRRPPKARGLTEDILDAIETRTFAEIVLEARICVGLGKVHAYVLVCGGRDRGLLIQCGI